MRSYNYTALNGMADLPRVLEMSLGVICGCMPYLAGFFKRNRTSLPQLSFLKNLLSRITSGVTGRFKSSKPNSDFNRVGSNAPQDVYLESHILGSVKGAGKFMESGVHRQGRWLGQDTMTRQSQGVSTVREEFND